MRSGDGVGRMLMIATNTQRWEPDAERFLTQAELGALLRKAQDLFELGISRKRKALVRDAALLFVAVYSGLRRFEICELMVTDLRIGNGRSYLIVRRGKNGKSRIVHIGAVLKKFLRAYLQWKADNGELQPESYLIRNERSEKYTPTGLWKRWCKYAINGHRLHDCRHTQASLLYQATKDIRLVAQQMGHSRVDTTSLYARVCPEIIQVGVEQMERLAAVAMKSGSKVPASL